MAMQWVDWAVVGNIITTWYTGSDLITAVVVIALFIMFISAVGIPIGLSLLLALPLVAGFVLGGWFGVAGWVMQLGLLVGGFIYAVAILKIMT